MPHDPRPTVRTTQLHRRLAHLLSTRGATPAADLAIALDLDLLGVRALTYHPWFRITGDGWALTLHGRSEFGLSRLRRAAAV